MNDQLRGYKKNTYKFTELAFLLLFVAYLSFIFLGTTTFYISFPNHTSAFLFILLSGVAALKWLVRWEWSKESLLGLGCAIVYGLGYISTGYIILLFLGVFTLGFSQINYQLILRLYSIILGLLLLSTFNAALVGGIDNFVYLKDGYIRSSLGIIYPTDMASYVFFLIAIMWVAWPGLSDFFYVGAGILCFLFSHFIARSITSTLLSILFTGLVIAHIVYRRIWNDRQLNPRLGKILECGVFLLFPIFTAFFFLMVFLYTKGFSPAIRINSLLSDRLYLTAQAYSKYHIRPFGTLFDMFGNGGSTFDAEEYNFIDCSYALILIRYGWVTLLVIGLSWSHTLRKAIKASKWRIVGVMVLIMVHSISEHHFIEMNYNILLVMPLSSLASSYKKPCMEFKVNRKAIAFLSFIILILLLVASPYMLSWIRTVTQINLAKGTVNGTQVFIVSVTFWLAVGMLLVSIYKLVVHCQEKLKACVLYIGIIIVCSTLVIIGVFKGNKGIYYGTKKYAPLIYRDKEALQTILGAAEGNVYINSFPDVYRRRYPEISVSVLNGDDLARFYNTTVIMDLNYDSNCFIKSGFLFTEISDDHCIYTNDKSVITALREKGYHLTGFYSHEKSINLDRLARMNHLGMMDGKICLNGEDESIEHGPYISLYSGKYTATFSFVKDDIVAQDDNLVATVCITAYGGEKELKRIQLTSDMFVDSECELPVIFDTGNYQNVEFQIKMEDGQSCLLEAISYKRSPMYDIHSLYNKSRVNYRDEYYDLEGNSTTTEEGYHACEYERNSDGAITEIRYYDSENMPVMITGGYACKKRLLDAKNRVIVESYYDIEDQPVTLRQGYHMEERVYDKDNNIITRRYLNSEHTPVITTAYYSEIHHSFNDKHQIIREEYYGTDGKQIVLPPGYASVELEYDSFGNISVERYFDVENNPVITAWNYAERHRKYNNKRQIIEETYYDTKGEQISLPAGYYIYRLDYDNNGNVISLKFFDKDATPIVTVWGYAEVKREYNLKRQIIKETFYDDKGAIAVLPNGYSILKRTYKDDGSVASETYYDKDGNMVSIN